MRNFIHPGKTLTLTAPYIRTSGQGALIGSIFGVATADVANGVEGEFMVSGVFELAKTSAQAWAQGERIYWDNTNKRCDNDPEVGQLIGTATVIAANPSSTGIVRLNGAVPGLSEGPQDTIAALTDSTNGAAVDGTVSEVTALATSGGNTYSDASVNAKLVLVNNANKELVTQLNTILAALKAAGIIKSA